MRRTRYRQPEPEGHSLLLFTAGALAGVAAGMFFARRFQTREEFFAAVRSKVDSLREYWNEADEYEENGRRERNVVDAYESEGELLDEGEEAVDLASTDTMSSAEEHEESDEEFVEAADAAGSPERDLEARVLAAFEADPVLHGRAIDISAVGPGVVELTGWVRSIDEAARAASIARQLPGVSMVLNRVGVRGAVPADATNVAPERTDDVVVRPINPEGPAA